jgi:DNA modification methylase
VFRKPGEFDRSSVPEHVRERSRVDVARFQYEKWYLSVWDIKNVLPSEKWSKYTAAFPEELVERLVRLYSYWGETVLDPFLGTGTTCAVARRLGRNCVGYEIDLELREAIEERLGVKTKTLTSYTASHEQDKVEVVIREDAKRLRAKLREEIEKK